MSLLLLLERRAEQEERGDSMRAAEQRIVEHVFGSGISSVIKSVIKKIISRSGQSFYVALIIMNKKKLFTKKG